MSSKKGTSGEVAKGLTDIVHKECALAGKVCSDQTPSRGKSALVAIVRTFFEIEKMLFDGGSYVLKLLAGYENPKTRRTRLDVWG